MSTELLNQFNEVAEKHLPAAVGEVLKKRLEEADNLESEVKSLKEQIDRAEVIMSDLSDNLKEEQGKVKQYIEREHLLNEKEEVLNLKQLELDQKEREVLRSAARVECEIIKRESAEKTVEEIKAVVGIIFKAPIARESVFSSSHQSGRWEWNNNTGRNEYIPEIGNTNSSVTKERNEE